MSYKSLKRSVSLFALIGGLTLAGCETTGTNSMADAGPTSLPPAPLAEDPLSQAAYWGARFEEDPSNMELAVLYSSSLRQLGSHEEAMLLMTRITGEGHNEPDVLVEFAKSLIAMRRGPDALAPLARAIAQRPDDWQALSLEGVAHDQAAEYTHATESYERALRVSPNNPAILNNYGLSRALAGDLDGAEVMLRTAAADPNATPQSRQNLALVLGLQGNFSEAERLARADLPPAAVANNVAYYRSMLTQPAAWNELGEAAEDESASE